MLNLANSGLMTSTLSSLLISCDAKLSLRVPEAVNVDCIDIAIDSPAWLDFQWDSVNDLDPISRATCRVYKGNSKFIYIREL